MQQSHSYDTRSVRRIGRAVQDVEAMPRPAGRPLRRLPSSDGTGSTDENLRVTGASSTTEGGVKYWSAKVKTWTDGTIGEADGEVWLFHFDQAQELIQHGLYHGRLYSDSFSVGGTARALYGTVDCECPDGQQPAPPPAPAPGPAPAPAPEPTPIPAPGIPFPGLRLPGTPERDPFTPVFPALPEPFVAGSTADSGSESGTAASSEPTPEPAAPPIPSPGITPDVLPDVPAIPSTGIGPPGTGFVSPTPKDDSETGGPKGG